MSEQSFPSNDPLARLQNDLEGAAQDTLAVRAGHVRTMEAEHAEAIFPTSSFVFSSAAEAARRFPNADGNIYSRFTNPTVRTFEQRIAAMEGGERAVATASGMAAISSLTLGMLEQGDHIVCSRSVFGSTIALFDKYLGKFGITTTYVDVNKPQEWEAAVQPNTKLFFLETPSNPLAEVADLRALATIARPHGIKVAVDNCILTPTLQQPLKLGADIVVHSATKYIDGQGRCLGGVVIGNHQDMEKVFGYLRTAGPSMSPFNAWVFLKGLETLRIRMQAHSASAQALAEWLEQHPKVARVYYSGLRSHPQHELARSQQKGFGGLLAFEVKGGQAEAWKVIDCTRMISITGNLGDTRTTITHPSTTTHGKMTAEAKAEAGIKDSLIRVSVGLEDIDDIKADLARGLDHL
ncbi:O-succinylhomoserine sulfhydrylase [Pokkaliibacter sp. MBI-7]|uniref:O-succinylhomoserine sulfhydrylase n=1 Tax=Pokkaliibacter sp. MBI-7 TaxID=3040600 RepID=UPI0024499501|nr:O-succinylhomoserine sulfhydrylase [Pokkaliibacter sp. MBI-7]MDH2435101.1 O-succinylhomoserine sulfhydrylase [Pokkaliibacter sp. MBI-7]